MSERGDGNWTISLEGELDLDTVPRVERGVDEAAREGGRGVLDLERIEFMDSSGIHLLLRLRERYDRERLAVRRPAGRAARVIEIAGVESHIGFAD